MRYGPALDEGLIVITVVVEADAAGGAHAPQRPASSQSRQASRAALWARWRPAVRIGLTTWLITRVCYLVLARIVLAVAPTTNPHIGGSWLKWPFTTFFDFDSGHFLQIAQHGPLSAGHDDPNVAFFPGYPMLGRGLSYVLGLGSPTTFDAVAALAIIAWIFSATAAIVLWRLVADELSPRTATAAVIILLAGPYSLFFVAAYSEGLFLTFALASWMCARQTRWGWAGVLCAAAMAVRVNAGFLLVGLLVAYVLDARRRRVRLLRWELASLALPLLTLLGYFAWLRARTGEWRAWFDAQSLGWDRRSTTPWHSLHSSLVRIRLHLPYAVRFQSAVEIVFAAILVIAIIVLLWRRLWAEAVYVGIGTATLLTSTYYLSIPRSTLLAFPVIVLVANWAVQTRHRWLVVVIAVACVGLAALNATTFVHGMWTD